jgi:hypothetical protein
MMPHTVPNRPINGADEPTVASSGVSDSSEVVSAIGAAQGPLDVLQVGSRHPSWYSGCCVARFFGQPHQLQVAGAKQGSHRRASQDLGAS